MADLSVGEEHTQARYTLTPVISSHGDVNLFERTLGFAMRNGQLAFVANPVFHSHPAAGPNLSPQCLAMGPDDWAATVQQARFESVQRRARSQEKNRLAAVKSRQRKKKEWDRLIEAEASLRGENEVLRERIVQLETQLASAGSRQHSQ